MPASLLALLDEDLAGEFAEAADGEKATVAVRSTSAAFTRAHMTDPPLPLRADGSLALEQGERLRLEARQADLDEQYLGLNEKFETSTGLTKSEREARDDLFNRARALRALLHLDDREYEEAVYEAIHVGSDKQSVIAEVRRLLTA